MLDRPSHCSSCPLADHGRGFMLTEGNGSLGVYAVAESLGDHEVDDGLPLRPQAPAGGVFDRTLRRAGINRANLAISNLCRCQPLGPPKNQLDGMWYEAGAINHCKQFMDADISRLQPKVILTMGALPLRYLAGYGGTKQSITNVRGFYLDGTRYPEIPVVATYHPSYIQRDKPNLLGVFRMDILRAIALSKAGGIFTRPNKSYTCFPPLDVAQRFLSDCILNPHLPIAFDIETDESIGGADESELRALLDGTLIWSQPKEGWEDLPEHIAKERAEEEGVDLDTIADYTSVQYKGSKITQIQFSIRPGEAIVLPWVDPFIQVAKEVLTTRNDKWTWNGRGFDLMVLAVHGARIHGVHHDMMNAWHHGQPDLPKGLQYVTSFYIPQARPWKHLAHADPGEYGGDDVAYLRGYGRQILDGLATRGLLKGYERHVVDLGEYVLTPATSRGIPVDDDRRKALGVKMDVMKGEVDLELQGRYPDCLRNVEPKDGYVNPKIAEKRMLEVGQGLGDGERWGQREFTAKPKGGRRGSGTPVDTEGGVPAVETRWCRVQPFSPNSGPQILRYIRYRRELEVIERTTRETRRQSREVAERNALYYVPKKYGTDKDTTEKKELERLAAKTGDVLFSGVLESRAYSKVKSTYVDGWAPWSDGRVHSNFTFNPATGQLSSKSPNCQTALKPGGEETAAEARKTQLAKEFRSCIRAQPGFKLVELDMTAFHALTLGFEARDADYMRMARNDIHSFVGANVLWNTGQRNMVLDLHLPPNPEKWALLPDEELRPVLAKIKKAYKPLRDKKWKPGGLGVGFGLGYRKLYDMNKRDNTNPRGYENQVEAKKILDVIKGLFPKIFRYQDASRLQAHKAGYLTTAHQYVRWFFDVFHWDSKSQSEKPGKDSEAAIAFRPANNAFGMIKEAMLVLQGRPDWNGKVWFEEDQLEKFGLINQIHDSLLFHCHERLIEECLDTVARVMSSPSLVLIDPVVAPGGLVCGLEGMVGEDWGKMETVKVVVPA